MKKKFDYEKYFSYELKGLLDYIGTDIAGEISFASLTFDIFLVAAIDYKDSMLSNLKHRNSFSFEYRLVVDEQGALAVKPDVVQLVGEGAQ